MAQGGSPNNTTAGNAGYMFAGEFATGRKHDAPGILSAAHSGPNTDCSQFFLTFVATPHLDGKHTVYGVVIEGLDTLKAIEACGTDEKPTETVSIVRTWITVVEKAAAKPAEAPKQPPGK
jgi:peptidylprolyl isomerase